MGALLALRMSSSRSVMAILAIMAFPPSLPSSLKPLVCTRCVLLGCSSEAPDAVLAMAQAEGGVKPVDEMPDISRNNKKTNSQA